MKTKNLIITTLFAGLVFLISIPSQARVLFDSTANSIFDLDPVSADFTIYSSFITNNQPIHLTFLTLRWRKEQEHTGNIHIVLLEDKNGYPGPVLDNLAVTNSSTLVLGDQWLTIPLKSTNELNAKTRYWIGITATGASGLLAYSREKWVKVLQPSLI